MQEAATTAVTVAASPWAVAAFAGYLVVVVAIGVWSARFSSEGVSEFFVGGRRMHRFVVALSAVVSGRSAWLLLGVTGMAYAIGVSAVWAVAGYTTAELFLFLYYAPRLRRFSERFDCVTIPDVFDARFGGGPALRLAVAAIILAFMIGYVAAQFVGGGKAFAAGFGLDETVGIALTAGIVLAYTALGGFLAVSLTDMVQAVVMMFALLVLPAVAIFDRGGVAAVVREITTLDATLLDPTAIALGTAVGFLGIGLGSPGNPHILVRYMSIRDAGQLRFTAVVGTLWNVFMALGALAIGLVGRVYFPSQDLLVNGDTETLYPMLAQQHLHPVLFGIVVASVFAAIMSTADSQLLVAASAVVRDVYEKVLRAGETLPSRRLVRYSRLVVVGLVAVALIFGMTAGKLVFWLVLFAWAGLGAALGPTSLLALCWRRTTRAGTLAGVAAGTITVVAWYYTPALKSRLYELIPAFLVGLVVTVLVSLVTAPPATADAQFDAMEAEADR